MSRMNAPPDSWPSRAVPLLGTLVELRAPAPDGATWRHWSDAAIARLHTVHAAMSFHDAASDLGAIARACAGDMLTVQPDTWQVLALAFELEAASNGDFDVAIAPWLVADGRLPRPASSEASGTASGPAPRGAGASQALRLLPGARVAVLRPAWIDLGGIAKGLAVDAAIGALRAAGAPAASVNAGGDLRVFGGVAHRIGVRLPESPQIAIGVADLAEGAFSTTAGYFLAPPATSVSASMSRGADGPAEPFAAIVDPGGAPRWREAASVSVAAPTCAIADALTKVLALRGPAAASLLRRYHARGLWVDADGGVHTLDPDPDPAAA